MTKKLDFVKDAEEQHRLGVTYADAVNTMSRKHGHEFTRTQVADMTRAAYDYMDGVADRARKRADKTERAVALYDALVAAGWTPPA